MTNITAAHMTITTNIVTRRAWAIIAVVTAAMIVAIARPVIIAGMIACSGRTKPTTAIYAIMIIIAPTYQVRSIHPCWNTISAWTANLTSATFLADMMVAVLRR